MPSQSRYNMSASALSWQHLLATVVIFWPFCWQSPYKEAMLEQGPLHALSHLSSSIIPQVLQRAEFWFMLGIHLMTWGGYQSGWFRLENYVASAVSVDWIDLKMLTVMTTFFLAFYVNQSFQRYEQSCHHLHRLFASVYDFAGEARLLFREKGAATAVRLSSRWLASCSLLCVEELQQKLEDEDWRKHVDSLLVPELKRVIAVN